ncbi:MAG TPA: signal peptidase I [Nocardioides sp.]|nr:signal peptidase I [Nocardioides sp.]
MTSHRGKNRARRLLDHAVTLVLVVLTALAAAYLAPSALGYERYVITGGSMTGTYDKGSVVFEKVVPVEELQVGDVITYQPPASSGATTLVTHRIIKITEGADGRTVYRTQGDNNPDPDPWRFSLTSPDQGVVTFSVPYVGWALVGLADRDTRMLVIGIPAGLIALISLVQLVGALRNRRHPASDAPAVDSEAADSRPLVDA